jgi:DNA gyrase/topoisomerase IV subunit A
MRNLFDIILGIPDHPDFCKICKRVNDKDYDTGQQIIEYCPRHSDLNSIVITDRAYFVSTKDLKEKIFERVPQKKITKYGSDYLKG